MFLTILISRRFGTDACGLFCAARLERAGRVCFLQYYKSLTLREAGTPCLKLSTSFACGLFACGVGQLSGECWSCTNGYSQIQYVLQAMEYKQLFH